MSKPKVNILADVTSDPVAGLPGSAEIAKVLRLYVGRKKAIKKVSTFILWPILLGLLPIIVQIISWWLNWQPDRVMQFMALGAEPGVLDADLAKVILDYEAQHPEPEGPKSPRGVAGVFAHPEDFGTERDVPGGD